MPPPPNVRYTANAPFPALVTGTGPITVTKQNGIWSVAFNMEPLAEQIPPFMDSAHSYFTSWNSTTNTFSRVSLAKITAQQNVPIYASQAAAAASNIPNSVTGLFTNGYAATGDGGDGYYLPTAGSTLGGFQSADGQWWRLAVEWPNVRQFGAKGLNNPSDNDTAALQAALNYAASGISGGMINTAMFLSPGAYWTDSLSVPSGVTFYGDGAFARSSGAQNQIARSTLLARSTGTYIIDITAASGATVNGITLQGRGGGGNNGGIRWLGGNGSFWNAIKNCFIWSMDNEAIYEHTTQMTITDCLADSCLLNRSRSGPSGVLTLTGTDAYVSTCEFSASINPGNPVSSSNMWCAAVAIVGGGNHWISDTLGELSDTGFYLAGSTYSRLVNCRSDFSAGHGFIGGDQLSNCTAYQASSSGGGVYAGFYTNGAQGVMYNNCLSLGSTSYGFDDSHSNYGGAPQRPIFSACRSFGHQSGLYNPPTFYETQSAFEVPNSMGNAGSASQYTGPTPSVEGIRFLDVHGQGALTITNFLNGVPLQELYVVGDSNQVIQNAAGGIGQINLNTSSNKILESGNIYMFKYFGGAWQELPNTPDIVQTVRYATVTPYNVDTYATAVVQGHGGAMVLNLPSAAAYPGKQIIVSNDTGFAVTSGASNVTPLGTGTPGAAILAASVGKWAFLQSDGANWKIVMNN
jgi:hypothetical protein